MVLNFISKISMWLPLLSDESNWSEDETEEDSLNPTTATCMLVLITILLSLSTLFDFIKGHIIGVTDGNMRGAIGVLFEDMTVLGFLSLTTFVLEKTSLLHLISKEIFGMANEDVLLEILDTVHYDLFLVMVIFTVQTLILVKLGERTSAKWKQMDKTLENFEEMEAKRKTIEDNLHHPHWWQLGKAKQLASMYELFEHASLKKEFLKGRRVIPPFDPFAEDEHLPLNFNYAQYLNLNLAEFVSDILEMNLTSWILLELWVVISYGVIFAVSFETKTLIFLWLANGYLLVLMMVFLKAEARWRLEMHINPMDMPGTHNNFQAESQRHFHPVRTEKIRERQSLTSPAASEQIADEATPCLKPKPTLGPFKDFVPWRNTSHRTLHATIVCAMKKVNEGPASSAGINYDMLPGWCSLPLDQEEKRSFLKRWICGPVANRQMLLYFFQLNGPAFDKLVLRQVLFMHAIYLAILWLKYYESAWHEFGPVGFAAVFVAGLLPSYFLIRFVLDTIENTVHTSSIGCLKNKKHIADVLRNMKVKKAINALVLLRSLSERFENADSEEPASLGLKRSWSNKEIEDEWVKSKDAQWALDRLREKIGESEFDEVCSLFDLCDTDKGGTIDSKELHCLMNSIGIVMEEAELKKTIALLDSNGDGTIAKVEFLLWHSDQKLKKKKLLSAAEMAAQLFKLFDKDGSGQVTMSELKEQLDQLNVGLSIDEIGALISELDEDGDNKISPKEFEDLLERYVGLIDEK